MGIVTRKLSILEALFHQRRASLAHPFDESVAHVRLFLESEIGPTVSLRIAARFLAVEPSALHRWTAKGSLPVVITEKGRKEIPVAALLSLRERVEMARSEGRTHVLEPSVIEDLERAARLDPVGLLDDIEETEAHGRAERRALAFHRAVAKRLTRADVAEARHVLHQWADAGRITKPYADAWADVLSRPVREIKRVISEDSQAARDLRQNSPFAGALSQPEVQRIRQDVH